MPALLMRGAEASWAGLDLLEGLLDRLVAGEVDLDRFDGVSRVWTFLLEGLDRMLGFLERMTAEKNVVGVAGLQERLDGLVADAIVAAGDENHFWEHHWCCLLSVR